MSRRSVAQKRETATLWIFGIGGTVLLLLLATLALDVLLLLVICGIAFLLERTAGDWLADAIGPVGSKVFFVGGVIFGTFILLSFGSVRGLIWGALAKADEAGFHSVLIDHLSDDAVCAAGPREMGRLPAAREPCRAPAERALEVAVEIAAQPGRPIQPTGCVYPLGLAPGRPGRIRPFRG